MIFQNYEMTYSTVQMEKAVMTTIRVIYHCNGKDLHMTFRGQARCHPSDTFDYMTGVKLATMRAEMKMYEMIYDIEIANIAEV